MRYALALLLCSCHSVSHYQYIYIEQQKKQYPDIFEGIVAGVKEWDEALDSKISLTNSFNLSGDKNIIIFIDYIMPDTLGMYHGQDELIVINPFLIGEKQLARTVTIHEIGHSLGLRHIIAGPNAEKYIMYPIIHDNNLNSSLSEVEINLARRLLGERLY